VARQSYRVRFTGRDGHMLVGIVDRPDDRDSFPCVVFSHCFTCSKDLKSIVRIARALSATGIGVLRFDMTGLGGSEGEFSSTSFTTNLLDLQAAIAFAESELGPVTALMGHSFGGAASLAMAASGQVSNLRSVVTLAAPSDTAHLAHLLARMNPEIEPRGHGTVSIGGRNWTIRREMLEDFRQHDLPKLISAIRLPTLILHSPDDETVGYDHALRIMGMLQSAPSVPALPSSLVTLYGADHLLSSDSDLVYVADVVRSFLMRYAQPG